MAKLKFKDENNNFIPVVQDVKLNGVSVFDGKEANINIEDSVIIYREDSDEVKIQKFNSFYDFENRKVKKNATLVGINQWNVVANLSEIAYYDAGIYKPYELVRFTFGEEAGGVAIFNHIYLKTDGTSIEMASYNRIYLQDKLYSGTTIKTIGGEDVLGYGNIPLDFVKYTANQELTSQQKVNARNNIEALGSSNIKQETGTSTTDVISQKGITDLLAEKQSNKPDGTHLLISNDTGKLDLIYIPSTVLGGITNGGTFNGSGVITASSYAPELQGEKIDEVEFGSYPSYYFICSAPYSFAGYDFAVGDWAISLGNGWAKLNATDAVTSVNGKMGQVVLDYDDVGATKKSWGIDNANKNLVTDAQGNVSTSDYALGQIIVDYYEELPTNVPETAKASVINSSSYFTTYTVSDLYNAYNEGDILPSFMISETITRPIESGPYISASSDGNVSIEIYYDSGGGAIEDTINMTYYDDNGDSHEYCYSFIQQPYAVDPSLILSIGWNEITYDDQTGEYISTQPQYSDLPKIVGNTYINYYDDNNTGFTSLFGYNAYHLAGDYIYLEIQPSTDPKTYYWKYNPSNVQADMLERDPLSLSYIRNITLLDTTPSFNLNINSSEEMRGTIQLHKISKTGNYNDLLNKVGRRDSTTSTGEVFNSYNGTYANIASGAYSHSEGNHNVVQADYGHSEGTQNTLDSTSIASHAEGSNNTINASYAHVEGFQNSVTGYCGHSEGNNCLSLGAQSHSEGIHSISSGQCSHAEGYYTYANQYQHVQGKCNVVDNNGIYCHIIGNGTSEISRSNAHTLDWNGNAWFAGNIRIGGTSWDTGTPIGGGGGGSVAKKKTLTNASQNYSVSNNIVTVTDNDVTALTTDVVLYPADAATETWLENNLSSCIITQAAGSFSFTITSNLPTTFSMYYIITEVE